MFSWLAGADDAGPAARAPSTTRKQQVQHDSERRAESPSLRAPARDDDEKSLYSIFWGGSSADTATSVVRSAPLLLIVTAAASSPPLPGRTVNE